MNHLDTILQNTLTKIKNLQTSLLEVFCRKYLSVKMANRVSYYWLIFVLKKQSNKQTRHGEVN